jgi:hypothetical protein
MTSQYSLIDDVAAMSKIATKKQPVFSLQMI